MLHFLISLFLVLVPSAHAESTSCTFQENLVMRSNALPYAGTLSEQKKAIETNTVVPHGLRNSMKFTLMKVGGESAYRFYTNNGNEIVENILYNHKGSSYQITLHAMDGKNYRRMLKHVRTLLQHPFGGAMILCN